MFLIHTVRLRQDPCKIMSPLFHNEGCNKVELCSYNFTKQWQYGVVFIKLTVSLPNQHTYLQTIRSFANFLSDRFSFYIPQMFLLYLLFRLKFSFCVTICLLISMKFCIISVLLLLFFYCFFTLREQSTNIIYHVKFVYSIHR